MATRYWMIADRNIQGKNSNLGRDRADLSYWMTTVADGLDDLENWNKVSADKFRDALGAAADRFPIVEQPDNEEQKHVTLFIHGFNNSWTDAVKKYKTICDTLFSGDESLGHCVLFTWPSDGSALGYLPDRIDAEKCAPDLADVLSDLYDWLLDKQSETYDAVNPQAAACKAKTSIIAHSMGNYVLQRAMQFTWTRKNRPDLVSLINQFLMIAADVDNDLFKNGDVIGDGDGDAIASLCYRVTALYSGRDTVLGASAGLKHFGQRRLGRSGLNPDYKRPSNVWDVDCTSFFPSSEKDIHSAYFKPEYEASYKLIEQVLRGVDRGVLQDDGVAPVVDDN